MNKKQIIFGLVFLFLISSVTAYTSWYQSGNAGFSLTSEPYQWLFSSPYGSYHKTSTTSCEIERANDFPSLIHDFNGDGLNEILIVDDSTMYFYNFTCGLVDTVEVGLTIVGQPILDNAFDTVILYLITSSKFMSYTYDGGFVNGYNISHGYSLAGAEPFSCGLNGLGHRACLVMSANNALRFDTVTLLNTNVSAVQTAQSQVNIRNTNNPAMAFTSTDQDQTVIQKWENSQGNFVQLQWINGTILSSCTMASGVNQCQGGVYLGGGSYTVANRILSSCYERPTAHFRIMDSDCNVLNSMFVTNKPSISNWIVSDLNKEGQELFSIMIINITSNYPQLNTYDEDGALQSVRHFSQQFEKTGYKEIVAVDMSTSYSGQELVTEDGIFAYDGTNYTNIYDITSLRTDVNGTMAVATTDLNNGITRAVYSDSTKTLIFGFVGIGETITDPFCGNDLCDGSETIPTCPVDCDPFFSVDDVCNIHMTPPCVYEHYFSYATPTKIQDKDYNSIFNSEIYPVNNKLDLSTTGISEEVITRFVPFTNKPFYTFEFKLQFNENDDVLQFAVGDYGNSLDSNDRVNLYFGGGDIGYYVVNSYGSKEVKTICNDCYTLGSEDLYKVIFFFQDTTFDIFDNTTNTSEPASKNTYALIKTGNVLKSNIPFLSTDGLDDGSSFDYFSFGMRDNNLVKVNLTIDNIYLYEGSNNRSSNVDDISVRSIAVLNSTKYCIGGFCKTHGKWSKNWDCNEAPQCCGYRTKFFDGTIGNYGVTSTFCVGLEVAKDIIMNPLMKWIKVGILSFIVCIILGGVILIIYLKVFHSKK